MKKPRLVWLKKRYAVGIISLIILLGLFWFYRSSHQAAPFESAPATISNLTEVVSITGTISSITEANLAFEKGGVIRKILVKVGQAVNRGQVITTLDNTDDLANLATAEANLADLTRPLRPEEQAVENAKVSVAQIALNNALQDAYTKTKNAVGNYTNIFFNNPESVLPIFNLPVDSDSVKRNLEAGRFQVNLDLGNWATDLAANSGQSSQTLIARSNTYIANTKKLLADLVVAINKLAPGNSSLTQSTINDYIASINSGLAILNQAESALSTAESNLSSATSNYSLKQAGNSAETIAAVAAKVDLARAELAKDSILSPIDGVVARIDPKLGEFATAGKTAFSVISNKAYKIEAFVPEADIAKIKIGNIATTTLDAYGSDTYFESKVALIDPAQTVIEGVPTYKVTLYFSQPDERIRSGMTANLDIRTNEKTGVLSIPYRAVINEDGRRKVRLVNPDGRTYTEIPISTGLRGANGLVEVTAGLKAGQKVVSYLKP